MLFNNFNSLNIQVILVRAIVLVGVLPIHEYAHAFVASKLGDRTAYYQGRLTLNPLAHLDPIGSVVLLLCGIGWAKPVPVNPMNFKNRKSGMALTALAGPVSNILVATIALILYKILLFTGAALTIPAVVTLLLQTFISINLSLAVFNLLPIPPLDGSKILAPILPDKFNWFMMEYQQYVTIILMGLLVFGVLDYPIYYLNQILFTGINWITSFVDLIARAL